MARNRAKEPRPAGRHRKPRFETLPDLGQSVERIIAVGPPFPQVRAAEGIVTVPWRAVVGNGGHQQRQQRIACHPAAHIFQGQGFRQPSPQRLLVLVEEQRVEFTHMAGDVDAARGPCTRRQQSLVLKPAVGLADVVQEGDGAEPLDQTLVIRIQAGKREQPAAHQRPREQRLQSRRHIGAVINERVPRWRGVRAIYPPQLPPGLVRQPLHDLGVRRCSSTIAGTLAHSRAFAVKEFTFGIGRARLPPFTVDGAQPRGCQATQRGPIQPRHARSGEVGWDPSAGKRPVQLRPAAGDAGDAVVLEDFFAAGVFKRGAADRGSDPRLILGHNRRASQPCLDGGNPVLDLLPVPAQGGHALLD